MDCKAVRFEIEHAVPEEFLSHQALRHLKVCASCRAFRDERTKLRHLLASMGRVDAPPDFDWKLRARLNSQGSALTRNHLRSRVFQPSMSALALAASFALLIACAVAYKQITSDRSPENDRPAIAKTVEPRVAQPPEKAGSSAQERGATENVEATASKGSKEDSGTLSSKQSGTNTRRISGAKQRSVSSTRDGVGARSNNSDYNTRAAEVLTSQSRLDASVASALIAVPLRSENGMTTPQDAAMNSSRKKNLEYVTFGAQEMIKGKEGAQFVKTSSQGVW